MKFNKDTSQILLNIGKFIFNNIINKKKQQRNIIEKIKVSKKNYQKNTLQIFYNELLKEKPKLSKASLVKLKTCHKDLQIILHILSHISTIPFGISYGERTVEKQQQLFKDKKTQLDGIKKKSKHNFNPSLAVDLYALKGNRASFHSNDLCFLAGEIRILSKILLNLKFISCEIRWGGNWDGDKIIMTDQQFQDLCHFEIK